MPPIRRRMIGRDSDPIAMYLTETPLFPIHPCEG
jgi:hypothetical protein